jgi:filamentous hemagglutinin
VLKLVSLKNKAGACAEVSAADSLVRQGVKPGNIYFIQAIRPKSFRQEKWCYIR